MKNEISRGVVQGLVVDPKTAHDMHTHMALLRHDGLGVTELRVFDPFPQVAYADGVDSVVRRCLEMDGRATGVYVGVQPRPAHMFDLAPNHWVAAQGGPKGNCARDRDIEYITAVFFDIDVVSPERQEGHPASEEELQETLCAARSLARQDGLALGSAVCCSGNGHYVLAAVVPIAVGGEGVARRFKCFCQQLADNVAGQFSGVRIDPVYNLSRVMRVMGTLNRKGETVFGRPHRRACFVTKPMPVQSMALHHMILNTEIKDCAQGEQHLPTGLKCDLAAVERCEFIKWCRAYPAAVSEPLWWGLITNLAYLEGARGLIHEISKLDPVRYIYKDTERVIERVISEGYKPVRCATLNAMAPAGSGRGGFRCPQIGCCPARAPMYMATSHVIYEREEVTPMQEEVKNLPIKVFHCGPVKAAIWMDHKVMDNEVMPVHSIQIVKSYKDGGKWKNAKTFGLEDLPKVAMVVTEAYKFLRLRSVEPAKCEGKE